MTADHPRPVPVPAASSQAGLAAARVRLGGPVKVWDIGDTEPRDVETRVEWGVRYRDGWHVSYDEDGARVVAACLGGTLVSRTVHVGPWEVAS